MQLSGLYLFLQDSVSDSSRPKLCREKDRLICRQPEFILERRHVVGWQRLSSANVNTELGTTSRTGFSRLVFPEWKEEVRQNTPEGIAMESGACVW